MKAMILAAGEGTRLMPLTKDCPKALVPFHGVPMLEILIRRLVKAGFNEIIINVFHFKDQIIRFVTDNKGFGADVVFSEEEELLDTGGGIKKAIPYLGDEPVLFHNVDVMTDIDIKKFYSDHLSWGGMASLATKDRPTSRHLLKDKSGLLIGWQHAENRLRIISHKSGKKCLETAFSCVYIIDPAMFKEFPEEEVFSFTPWIIELLRHYDIKTWDHDDDYWFDMGTVANLKRAEQNLLLDPNKAGSFVLR
jgi:MurNAc alpha-1-phosphate uridylyltransferase